MEIYAQITKVDEARREVWGRAAQEIPDRAGEIMDFESSRPFFEDWSNEIHKSTDGKSMGNVRSMHGQVAAGKVIALTFDDAQKAVDVGVKVVDDNEWEKVLEGVHSGFSIGGRYEKKWRDGEYMRYTVAPSEISLVDRPCIPTATFFNIQKADGSTVRQSFKSQPEALNMNQSIATPVTENAISAVDRLADMLTKGVVTPQRLVELAGKEPRKNPHLDKLQKGLDQVSSLASLLSGLAWLQQACQWEAQIEGDASPVPASILAAVQQLASALVSMADEETKEVLAALLPDNAGLAQTEAALAQNAKRGLLSKAEGDDLLHIQAAHDHLVACGAVCPPGIDLAADPAFIPEDTGNDGVNAPQLTPVKAAQGEFAKKAADENAKLRATIEQQNAALEELGKRLKKIEEQPLPAKGVLRAVGKEEDVEQPLAKNDIVSTPGVHNPEAAQALIRAQFEQRAGLR
jgi:hypothetical protein